MLGLFGDVLNKSRNIKNTLLKNNDLILQQKLFENIADKNSAFLITDSKFFSISTKDSISVTIDENIYKKLCIYILISHLYMRVSLSFNTFSSKYFLLTGTKLVNKENTSIPALQEELKDNKEMLQLIDKFSKQVKEFNLYYGLLT